MTQELDLGPVFSLWEKVMAKQGRQLFPGWRRSRYSLVNRGVWLGLSHCHGDGVGQRRLGKLASFCTHHTMPVWVWGKFSQAIARSCVGWIHTREAGRCPRVRGRASLPGFGWSIKLSSMTCLSFPTELLEQVRRPPG